MKATGGALINSTSQTPTCLGNAAVDSICNGARKEREAKAAADKAAIAAEQEKKARKAANKAAFFKKIAAEGKVAVQCKDVFFSLFNVTMHEYRISHPKSSPFLTCHKPPRKLVWLYNQWLQSTKQGPDVVGRVKALEEMEEHKFGTFLIEDAVPTPTSSSAPTSSPSEYLFSPPSLLTNRTPVCYGEPGSKPKA